MHRGIKNALKHACTLTREVHMNVKAKHTIRLLFGLSAAGFSQQVSI